MSTIRKPVIAVMTIGDPREHEWNNVFKDIAYDRHAKMIGLLVTSVDGIWAPLEGLMRLEAMSWRLSREPLPWPAERTSDAHGRALPSRTA